MSVLRDIWSDLVDKKLWPFALLLLAGVVAVPVLLTRTATSAGVPAPASLAANESAVARSPLPVVDLSTGTPIHVVDGSARDPFTPAPQAVSATAPSAASVGSAAAGGKAGASGAATAKTGAATGAAGSSTASGSASHSTQSATSATGTTHPAPSSTTRTVGVPVTRVVAPTATIALRLGVPPAIASLRIPIPMTSEGTMTVVPNRDHPVAVLLGITRRLHNAVFLVSRGESVLTAGTRCFPSRSDCREVELGPGDHVTFGLVDSHNHPFHYVLEVTEIRVPKDAVIATASAAATSDSPF